MFFSYWYEELANKERVDYIINLGDLTDSNILRSEFHFFKNSWSIFFQFIYGKNVTFTLSIVPPILVLVFKIILQGSVITWTSISDFKTKLNGFDKNYKYVIRVEIPFNLKDDITKLIYNYLNH